jgi:hypothetical protein
VSANASTSVRSHVENKFLALPRPQGDQVHMISLRKMGGHTMRTGKEVDLPIANVRGFARC